MRPSLPGPDDGTAVASPPLPPHRSRTALIGALAGLLGLVGMVRLTAGAFDGALSRFAWVVVLAAMVPWVVYVAWRAGRGRLPGGRAVLVLVLVVVGAAAVWLGVLGSVLALACSLAASTVIWVSDWPERRPRGEDRFVRIADLQREDDGT